MFYRMKSPKNQHLGFSLIELIIVIAIMGVLIGLLAPSFAKQAENNRKKVCRENRLAILTTYQRCVYDTSTSIGLNDTDLKKFTEETNCPNYVKHELSTYWECPIAERNGVGSTNYSCADSGVDENTNTAWIHCPDCGDDVSIDMIEFSATAGTAPSEDKYRVSFNLGGHGTPPAPLTQELEDGDTVTRPADPTDPEYTFECWKLGPDIYDFAQPVHNSFTLTAQWKPAGKHEVTFDLGGHGTSPVPDKQEIDDGDTVTQPADPEDLSGGGIVYTFDYWAKDGSKYNFASEVHSDFTLVAQWKAYDPNEHWPYADDWTWWQRTADGQYLHSNKVDLSKSTLTGTANNMTLYMKYPSGIFTSRNGAKFVWIDQQPIKLTDSYDPETFSAMHPQWLLQITGHYVEVDMTGSGNNDWFMIPATVSIGDVVRYKVAENVYYEYVYFHTNVGGAEGATKAQVIQNKKLGNLYPVNPGAVSEPSK